MYQGSENVGKSEHFILVDTNGGDMNGTTDEERTLYYETLPANQLELALFLEADRMRALDITKENLDNQRAAVQEERRLRLDNQPYGKFFEQLNETTYDNFNCWAGVKNWRLTRLVNIRAVIRFAVVIANKITN